MSVDVSIEGLEKLNVKLGSINKAAQAAVLAALNRIAGEIFAQSQRLTPVDTGNLRASGRILAAKEDNLEVVISYGGTAAQYALTVHENHKTHSKYLERALRSNERRFKEEIVNATKKAL